MKTVCGQCSAEYDDQFVSHRASDCVSRLRSMCDDLHGKIKRLQSLYQDHADSEDERETKIGNRVTGVEQSVAQLLADVDKRISALGRRITLLEHPKMAEMPSMKK